MQPALGDPPSAGGLDRMTHRGPFQPLPFCHSVMMHVAEVVVCFCDSRFDQSADEKCVCVHAKVHSVDSHQPSCGQSRLRSSFWEPQFKRDIKVMHLFERLF